MKDKQLVKGIYLLLVLSVVANALFFVQWLGERAQAQAGRESLTAEDRLEEENAQLKARIDELLASSASSTGVETDPAEETEQTETTGAEQEALTEQKKQAFLQQFAALQFGMGSDQVAQHVAELERMMSADAFQELNGSLPGGASGLSYSVEVEETQLYRSTAATSNEYILVVSQETKTDQENATAVHSQLYYRVQLGTSEEGRLFVESAHALMPYQ